MLFINLAGIGFIGLIVWWFWLFKPEAAELGESGLLVSVDSGVYTPARINIAAGSPVEISFIRRDASPCAETLLIPSLQISETLPLNKEKLISLPALSVGKYEFHCQMQMYRGQIIVK